MNSRAKKVPDFTKVQLTWVADHIESTPRQKLFDDFVQRFERPLGRNHLAGMMKRHGGNKADFIRDNRTEEKIVPKKKESSPPESPVQTDKEDLRKREAELGGIIASAYKEWDPDTASFKTANALAAMRVNEKLNTGYQADDIAPMVSKMGGAYELLLDCGSEQLVAEHVARKIKRHRK